MRKIVVAALAACAVIVPLQAGTAQAVKYKWSQQYTYSNDCDKAEAKKRKTHKIGKSCDWYDGNDGRGWGYYFSYSTTPK